jgi:NTE family protein
MRQGTGAAARRPDNGPGRAWRRAAGAILALALLAGCASTQVPMNQPLAAGERNRDYSLPDVNLHGGRADLVVLVSFSGGGKRSAAFGHGALRGMREIPVAMGGAPSTLLAEVDQVAGVSGGSFPAAHFGLNGERSFETFPEEFLYRDVNSYILGTFLLPWNWEWLVNPFYGTNDRMSEVYDRLMFRGATFADLIRRGRPQVSINATDISYGLPFAFIAGTFDLICSDLASFPVSRAVAASNGFPVLFTPITLQNHRGPGCSTPLPWRPDAAAARLNFRTRHYAEALDRYLDPVRTPWIHLMDGGISDNLALRASLNSLIIVQRQAQLFADVLRPIRRLLVISVDGQSAANPELPRQRVVSGLTQIFGAVSGTQIDNYNVETLMLAEAELIRLVARIRQIRCAAAPVIDGHPCEDVHAALTRVSLSDYPEEAERQRLQAIPTGLTIAREFVDQLVLAGERMVREDQELRTFLAPQPAPVPATAAAARRAPRRG